MTTPRRKDRDLWGSSDGGDPNWRENVMAMVAKRTKPHRRARSRTALDMSYDTLALLKNASRARDMTQISYIRRAVAAFLAHDTGEDFATICQDWPKPMRPGQQIGGGDFQRPRDDGTGHGEWRVC